LQALHPLHGGRQASPQCKPRTPFIRASRGYLRRRAQGQVQTSVRKLLARYTDEVTSISTTGHSLGGALASLCAFDLVRPNAERRQQPARDCCCLVHTLHASRGG